jgi:hypothetical protein
MPQTGAISTQPQFNNSYMLSQALPTNKTINGGFSSSQDSTSLQLIGKDGKVKGILNEVVWAGGARLYHYLSGNGATALPLPKNISNLADAKAYVAARSGSGSWKNANQGAADTTAKPAPARSEVNPKSNSISGGRIGEGTSSPVTANSSGEVVNGKITQISWNTGSGGSSFIFQGAGITKELPPGVKTLAAAQRFVKDQFATGKWSAATPLPKLYSIPDNQGKISVWSNGTTQSTELKARRTFQNGEWRDAGFVAQEARIYTSNKLLSDPGQPYDAKEKGYLVGKETPVRSLVMDKNGKAITSLDDAKKRVAQLMTQGTFTRSTLQVSKMSPKDKLTYMVQHALKNVGPAAAEELKSLLTVDTLAKAALLGGAQFIPGVNFAVNIFAGILVGKEGIELGMQFVGAINSALNAKTTAELDSAGMNLAEATARLGVGVGSAVIGAGAAKVAGKLRPGIKSVPGTKPGKTTSIDPAAVQGKLYGNSPGNTPVRSPLRTPNAADGSAPRPVGYKVPSIQKSSKTPKGQFATSGANGAEGAYRNRNPRSETAARAASAAPVEPVTKMEKRAAAEFIEKTFPDFASFMLNMSKMSTTGTENASQKNARIQSEKQIKTVAESMGYQDIKNVKIERRPAKNIIIASNQQSSAALSPDTAAADISFEATVKNVPVKVSLTSWYNPGVFVRSPNIPYVEGAGNLDRSKLKGQTTARLGGFEMGIQPSVGLNYQSGQSKYLNAGFSMIARGAHAKAVIDISQKGKLSATPSVNFSVDGSAYMSIGPVRGTSYVELGRVLSAGKKFKVFDIVNIGVNPALVNDTIEKITK